MSYSKPMCHFERSPVRNRISNGTKREISSSCVMRSLVAKAPRDDIIEQPICAKGVIMSILPKLKTVKELMPLLSRLKKHKKKIVFTNGCFDILHVGHVRYLSRSKSLGHVLVIGLNTDLSVRAVKGPQRPVTPQKERAEVLSALSAVDFLVFFSEPTPLRLIQAIRPDFLVKGGDWKKKDIVGSAFVESYGGKELSLPYVKGFSTTALLEKIKSHL